MTFAELAEARGTTKRAAVVLVRRHGWRKQRNNAGHVIALVPHTWAETTATDVPGHRGTERERHNAGHSIPHSAPTITETLAEANRRADEANQRADAALALADRLGAQLADAAERLDRAETERRRADALVANLEGDLRVAQSGLAEQRIAAEQARADAQEAQSAAEALRQAEAARKARGRLARAWRAWRGE